MTSLAFILGVFPLVISSGAGAAARRSMGTGVFGGMVASTVIATIFIPMFFTWVSRKQPKQVAAEGAVTDSAKASASDAGDQS
jgi:HAE1 family hydrophobic/amphiphilic exporter-1/multidrug efflux pump